MVYIVCNFTIRLEEISTDVSAIGSLFQLIPCLTSFPNPFELHIFFMCDLGIAINHQKAPRMDIGMAYVNVQGYI